MSRLWNRLWPAPPGAIGLGFSGNRALAVRLERAGDGYLITHAAEETLPFMPFAGAGPRPEDSNALAEALQRLAAAIPQRHWPLRIALPDPAAIVQVLEFESLPRHAQERAAIGRFRMEKEWPAVAQMDCVFQVLSEDAGRATLIASAVQRAWLDCLRTGCRTAGWVPSVTDIAATRLFNLFHDAIAAGTGDGALISIAPNTWSILLWDEARRLQFLRSRWREADAGAGGDYETIAQDVERLVRAYVLGAPGRRIGEIYLCGDGADRTLLAERLNARMRAPCIHLDVTEGVTAAPGISIGGLGLGVLAAAMQQL